MSNMRGRSVITNNTKEVVISVKNQPNTSYAETENISSNQDVSKAQNLNENETLLKDNGKRFIGTAQTVVSNMATGTNNLEQIGQAAGSVKENVYASLDYGKTPGGIGGVYISGVTQSQQKGNVAGS